MAKPYTSVPRISRCLRTALRPAQPHLARAFSASAATRTDGVYTELTAMRTRIPFIEALKNQQEDAESFKPKPIDHAQRDLSPKTMSDSYHQVVSHVYTLRANLSDVNVDTAIGSRSVALGFIYHIVRPY